MPPGWYTDPWEPQAMRWWDGSQWGAQTTAHNPSGATGQAPTSNGLTDLGQWIGDTFSLAIRRAGHVFTIMILTALPGSIALNLVGWAAADGLQVVKTAAPDRGTTECTESPFASGCIPDYDLVGWNGDWLVPLLAAGVLTLIGFAVAMLAIAHQLHSAASDTPAGWGESLVVGVRTLPRFVAFGLVVLAALLVTLVGATVVGFVSPVLGVLLGIASLPLLVFFWIKFSFFTVASAVAPSRTNTLAASWRISTGAMMPVVGRLLLLLGLGFALTFAGNILTSPINSIASAGLDDQQLIDILDFDGPSAVWGLSELVGNPAPLILSAVLNTLVQVASLSISLSGLVLLYRQRSGPARQGPTADIAPVS